MSASSHVRVACARAARASTCGQFVRLVKERERSGGHVALGLTQHGLRDKFRSLDVAGPEGPTTHSSTRWLIAY